MPTVAIKLSLEDLSSALEQLNESEIKKLLEKIRDKRKKEILERGYQKLAKISFDDLGSEADWLSVENEAIEKLEKDLS